MANKTVITFGIFAPVLGPGRPRKVSASYAPLAVVSAHVAQRRVLLPEVGDLANLGRKDATWAKAKPV